MCFFVWTFLHLPGIFYETDRVTFMTYAGDEQSPVNGALHLLEEKSPLGLRNRETLYYGPVFAVIALPAVVWDYASLRVQGAVRGASDYKNSILWNWGGILWKTRAISVFAGFFGLIAFYLFLNTKTINPSRNKYLPFLGSLMLASNFFYFEYASFFRHWIFIATLLVAQIYVLIKIAEDEEKSAKYWTYAGIISLVGFGISYIFIFFQTIWIPAMWLRRRGENLIFWRRFRGYCAVSIFGMALIVWWHPYAFFRMFGWLHSGVMGEVPEAGPKIFSYSSYLRTLMNALFPLWILWLALVAHLLAAKKAHRLFWFWMPVVSGAAFFAVFGSYSHFESRYVLPLVALFFISFFSLLTRYCEYLFSKPIWKVSIAAFLSFAFFFHATSIFAWDYRFLSRVSEEKKLTDTLTKRQEENKNFSALMIEGDLLGVPHTKEAYRAYRENCEKRGVRLYDELLLAPFPKEAVPLNIYYGCSNIAKNKERGKHDTIIFVFKPPVESDFYDANAGYLWFTEDFQTRYFVSPTKTTL